MKWTAKKVQFFTKKVKLSTKTSFIKLKCDIIKIIECTKSIYDKIEKHMVGFVKYCKMQFPVTMSTISYKTFVFKRKLKSGAKNVSRLCKEKLKAGGLLLAKFTRKFCTEIYCLIIKAFGLLQLICVRAICHIRAFGKLSGLSVGNIAYFKDVNGVVYKYHCKAIETLAPNKVYEMQTGDWDLTLFTCTYNGANRVAYRFEM